MISGVYRSKSEVELLDNIKHAELAARKLWIEGWAVICPHKNTAFLGGLCDDSVWIDGALEFLKRSDAVYMLNNWRQSDGAKTELLKAQEWGKQIIYEIDC